MRLDSKPSETILREVLMEVLDQRRDWFTAVVAEAMADAVVVRASKEGEETELVAAEKLNDSVRFQ